VYVDLYNGVIVDKNIVRQSIHHIGGDRAREVFGSYPQRIYNAMYVATLNGTVQTLDSNINYLWIHNWFNYYHWFTETFLRLWIANESHPDYTILLPEKLREIPFVSQSLSLFPGLRMQFLSSETQVYRIPKLHLVVQKPYCEEYDTDLFPKIANEIKSKILLAEQKIERNSHKVYVSRKQSNRRTFVNESDVVALFERFQYTILYTETMSFSEQVVAFSNTTVLVSMHGAGLTNMMWMPHGSKVFEIHRRIRNRNDHHSLVYYTMASALGHQYYYQWCDDGDNADFFEGNLIVNIEELEKNLIEIEK
jgi:capsular polysaccharide biosynthesis protein